MSGRGLYENVLFGAGMWLVVIMLLAVGFSTPAWAAEGGVALAAESAVAAGGGTSVAGAGLGAASADGGVSGTGARSGQAEAEALDEGESVQGAMDNFDFQDIQDFINQQKGETGWNLSFQEVMKDLMAGHLVQVFEKFLGAIKNTLFAEIHNGGVLMGQIIILGIFGAVFTNFSSVFNGSQISETGFFVTYLLLFTFLTTSFFQSITIASDVVGKILDFMKVLMPTYFMAVAFAGGSVSSVAMYEFTLWIITAAQWLIGSGLIPLVRVYMILVLASHISKEEIISNLTELLEQIIGWGLKTLIGVVLGFHVIQGLVLPYVDSVKNSAVQKLIGLIPGIGQGASAVTQMILGSGVLIKNTMGMAAVIILLVIVAVPVMKLAVLMVLYRCVAAVLEPVCDKRLVSCVSAAAKGHKLLLNMVMAAALLLIITVAVVCAGTNVSYYA